MSNGQIGSFMPAQHMFKNFSTSKIRKSEYRYGFGGAIHDINASAGLNTYTDLAAVSSWRCQISGVEFSQATEANQPRYIASDANFNNFSSVDFQSGARNLQANAGGLALDPRNTLLLVYRKQADASSGLNRRTTCLATSNSSTVNVPSQFTFSTMSSNTLRTNVGYTSGLTELYVAANPYDTNPHILVVNSNVFIDNGVSVSVTGSGFPEALLYMMIGGVSTATGGIFQLRDLVVYNYLLTSSEAIKLSDNANLKYAIY